MANGHGGPRQGTPGKAYGNRSDLMNNYAPAGSAAPLPAAGMVAGTPAGAPPAPAGVVPLGAPTQRHGEHVMAGAPIGPGGGPADHGLPMPGPENPTVEKLRALYLADPDPGLGEMLSLINEGWL